MMSEMGKQIMKAVPALELSTQDFILRSKCHPQGIPSSLPLPLTALQQSLNGCPSKITFNLDGKYYTPAFVGQSQESLPKGDDRFLREIFERKIVESSNSKIQLFQPKPSSNYCYICRESFQDYLKHTAHPVHQKKLAASHCHEHIAELCLMVRQRARREGESGEELAGTGRKRRKMEQAVGLGKGEMGGKSEEVSLTVFQQIV